MFVKKKLKSYLYKDLNKNKAVSLKRILQIILALCFRIDGVLADFFSLNNNLNVFIYEK